MCIAKINRVWGREQEVGTGTVAVSVYNFSPRRFETTFYPKQPAMLLQVFLFYFLFSINHYSYLGYLVYDERPHLHAGCPTPEPVSAPELQS